MKPRQGILSLLTVLLIFLVVGGAVAWRLLSEDDATPASTAASRPELPDTEGVHVASVDLFGESRPVEAAPVVRDTLWLHVVGNGTSTASRRSAVATRTSGVVQAVYVREGAVVGRGQILVQLDTIQAGMNLIRARSALTQAQARYESLAYGDDGGLLTPQEREDRDRVLRADLTTAELNLQEREMELEFTRVRAPFSGHVADLSAVVGSVLSSGQDVLTLVQLDPIHVTVDVLESEIGLIARGRRASVRFNALGGQTLTATVESVNPRVDRESRSGRVTLTLPNPGYRILPGNYVWVSLEAQGLPDRVLIPRTAVTMRGPQHEREVVFLLKNGDEEGRGLADWKYVTLGRSNETLVEIMHHDDTSMLAPGDIVLVAGHHYLAHDTRVHVVDNVIRAGGAPGR